MHEAVIIWHYKNDDEDIMLFPACRAFWLGVHLN
jgi:hypothetical protein